MDRFSENLEKALQIDDVETVQTAIGDKPELISFMDEDGMTMLHLAASHGSMRCAELLLDLGADIEAADGDHRNSPLGWAAFSCKPDMVKLLLDSGANPDYRDGYGNSPLDYARQGSQGLLKQWGAMTPEDQYLPVIEILEEKVQREINR